MSIESKHARDVDSRAARLLSLGNVVLAAFVTSTVAVGVLLLAS